MALFAPFTDAELAEIAAKAADVHVLAGEYLVREGEEAYFYVLLDGTMTVTKRVGTREPELATRERGEFFGETPVLLGADTVANLRAESDARLMRLDPFDFQALVARNATFKATMLTAMSERIHEMGRRASARRADAVIVVGHRWDVPCRDARTLLARNRVRHEYLVVENPTTRERVPDIDRYGDQYPLVRLVTERCSCSRPRGSWRTLSACKPNRTKTTTTRSSSAAVRRAWRPPSTVRRKACLRS